MFRKALNISLIFLAQLTYAKEAQIIPEVRRSKTLGANYQVKTPTQTKQISIISEEELKESPALNLQTVFKQQQSIVRPIHTSGDDNQTALSIRGFGDNAAANALILVDGFPLTNPSLLAPNFNSIALIDVAGVTIIQGSQGTLLGDQAIGGVVNIKTSHPENRLVDALLGVGSFNKKFFSALAGDKFKYGFFIKVFGASETTHNYRQHNQSNNNNIRLEVGRDYRTGSLGLNLQAYNTHIQFPGGLSKTEFNENPRQATNFSYHFQYHTDLLQLINKQTFKDNYLLETRFSHQSINGQGFIFIKSNVNEWQDYLEPRLVALLNQNKITLGYYGEKSGYHLNNKLVANKTTEYQQHLFSQVVLPLFNKYEITIGTRYAAQHLEVQKEFNYRIDDVNKLWVTELGFSFKPNEAWQFFLRRDGNFRFIKANEAIWTSKIREKLTAQTGASYEAGMAWLGAEQKVQLSLYALILQNEIAFDARETLEEPFGHFNNFKETRRLGMTVTDHYQLTRWFAYDLQFNYVNARFTQGFYAGKQIPAVPILNGNLALNLEFINHGFLKYYLLYTGARFASDDNYNTSGKLPPYWLNNLALQYMLNHFQFSFEIENIFNQVYAAYTWYDVTNHQKLYYPGAGRSYLFTIRMNLN